MSLLSKAASDLSVVSSRSNDAAKSKGTKQSRCIAAHTSPGGRENENTSCSTQKQKTVRQDDCSQEPSRERHTPISVEPCASLLLSRPGTGALCNAPFAQLWTPGPLAAPLADEGRPPDDPEVLDPLHAEGAHQFFVGAWHMLTSFHRSRGRRYVTPEDDSL